ncbi:MAG: hypothetical protein L3J28_04085 [Candidatus Polarisedimenticolaceae bacterium]|nr:hypothetical protein [Candidatus Polarisedimenticolaceae bacterium]
MVDTVSVLSDTVLELKEAMEEVEADGSLVVGIHIPAKMAKKLHFELYRMHSTGADNELILLFGAEVLSQEADKLTFITSDQQDLS